MQTHKVSFKKISLECQAYFTFVLVAQLNRATGCGPVGRGFESLRARHSFKLKFYQDALCFLFVVLYIIKDMAT